MPTITAASDSVKSQIRLDVDCTDTDAPYVLVSRVDPVTGAATQVRGHGSSVTVGGVAYAPVQAGYKAVLYDTEAPLDSAVYYTLTAPVGTLNANPTFDGGYTDPWFVTDPAITMRPTSDLSGNNFLSFFTAGATATPTIRAEDIPATPNASITATLTVSMSASNGVVVGLTFRDSTGAVLSAPSASATVLTSTVITVSGTAPANTVTVQPFIQMSGTPAANVTCNVDSLYVTNTSAGSAISGPALVQSLGACQLKDPLRPGNSVRIDFSFDPNPLCTPTEGVFWQSLDTEQRAANSAVFNVNNQALALVVSKVRSAMSSTLTLVSRTFADKTRLETLLAPESALLFQVPDEYGIPDMYLAVGATSEARVLPDHRIPIRVFALPFAACAAPGGPMQGTVGTRWQDTCNRYATWGAVNAAGLTWYQILDGQAG